MSKKPTKQAQIAALFNTGLSDKEIAERVGTNLGYVHNSRYRINHPEDRPRRAERSLKRYQRIVADPERLAHRNELRRKRYKINMKDREYRREAQAKGFRRQ